jgi:hypothetical protein|tara:strand:- start:577 stop:1119 length:543 start_codon:yes stop_codon:yes gene_type:complete
MKVCTYLWSSDPNVSIDYEEFKVSSFDDLIKKINNFLNECNLEYTSDAEIWGSGSKELHAYDFEKNEIISGTIYAELKNVKRGEKGSVSNSYTAFKFLENQFCILPEYMIMKPGEISYDSAVSHLSIKEEIDSLSKISKPDFNYAEDFIEKRLIEGRSNTFVNWRLLSKKLFNYYTSFDK